jgi:ornithine cyclodeaminase/alanine dehydrogenase-like protein (mu-crystallin family)
VAVIGAGVIARTILRYMAGTAYPIDELLVFDLDPASAGHLRQFATEKLGVPCRVAGMVGEAFAAQTVILATTALAPHVATPLRPGQVVLNISLRDLQPEVIAGAQNYFDDVEHCMKAGTSPHLAEQATGGRDFVTGTLADVLRGKRTPNPRRGVVFSPFGLGVLDLALGHYVLTSAREQGLTREVADFFGEHRRW